MKRWSLASRIVSGTLIIVLSALMLLSILVAAFTRYEVTERLDNSLQEVAERLEFVIGELDKRDQAVPTPGGQVARLPGVNRRTLAYQIASTDGLLEVRSQNAPETLFVPHLAAGFYNIPEFRVYIVPSVSGHHYILVGEPTFHRNEAVRRAILISVLPMVIFFPAIWILVRWRVRRAMQPLTSLQQEIRSRGGANLTPIPPLDLPVELVTIHSAVNLLLERLKMALSTERAFAANAAHELRNPIGALLAQVQILRGFLQHSEHEERATTIMHQARRIGRMMEKLLQLSRVTSGIALTEDRFDLVPVIRFLAEELEREKDQTIKLSGASHLMIRGDMDTAGILFRNLLENAVLHGTSLQPVRLLVTDDSKVLIFNDCDPLTPEILQDMEKPFVRGKTDAEGSGLGLAIVRQVSLQFQADITITSPIPGTERGIVITVHFPPSDIDVNARTEEIVVGIPV
ncbi:MAG: HAMP domain-containing histidine kinase [Acetobacter sp.]|jgi:two-component system OmpR family sensor kinase|nr:HAMP domain-containing histidine kinase [Acetobacter sp.]MCH4060378.1 HAMP domain-containing histidine kinase [Acetobacter sp.]MCH4087318.1 HAMP domain-containing histidine kinase [Acetobacter sp.]MCI1294917.1 HAMP domain-containing histidine kinase [Acetobacter sp.]MCI1321508.1 HAMP domain-containing histidine kinase [Acetobacter sp.]